MSVRDFWQRWARSRDVARNVRLGRLKVGEGFELQCDLFLTGPGRVEIGDNVTVRSSFWDKRRLVTFATHSPGAVIRIGDNTMLEGTRFGCRILVEIGSDCFVGESTIKDTDFHSMDFLDRDAPEKVNSSPVVLERGVRVSYDCHILRGVTIGRDTVVRPHSIVSDSLPAGVIASGYPARAENGA